MKKIFLTQGKFTIVDDEDFEQLNQWKWHYNLNLQKTYGYAKRWKNYSMSREILKAPKGLQVDHINGDTLDNRKENLRLATKAENAWNQPAHPHSSKFKGVYFNKNIKKWQANIRKDGKILYLGLFITEEEAAIAYDSIAKELHGKFARLNFPKK